MSKDDILTKLEERMTALEEAKRQLEKKLYAAAAVAVALGAAGLWGGSFVSSIGSRLAALSERTGKLEKSADAIDKATTAGTIQVRQAAIRSREEIIQAGSDQVRAAQTTLQAAADQAKKQLLSVKASEILAILQNGKENLRIHNLELVNNHGSVVFRLFVREGEGTPQETFFDSRGIERMAQFLGDGGSPNLEFEVSHNHPNLWLGDYSDSGGAFVQLNSADGATSLLKLEETQRGGSIEEYERSGKQVVFLGPDSNSGVGLLNLIPLVSGATKSVSP